MSDFFNEVDQFLSDEKENQLSEPRDLFEEVDQFVAEIDREVPEKIDVPSTGEALGQNLIIGFHDYISLLPGDWQESKTIDEWREGIEKLQSITPDVANNLFMSSSKYVSDAVALYAARGQLIKHKYTADMVRKTEKMLTSKKYKESMIAAALLAEAEEALSSAIHKEEYTPGMGVLFGSTVAGTIVSGQKIAPHVGVGLLKAKKIIDNAKEQIDILHNSIDKKDTPDAPKTTTREDKKEPSSIDARVDMGDFYKDVDMVSKDKAIPLDRSFKLEEIMDANNAFFDELRDVQIAYRSGSYQPQVVPKSESGGKDIIEIGEDYLKRSDIRSILNEEMGHIIDRNRGLTEAKGLELFKTNISRIANIADKSGKNFAEEAMSLVKYFHPSELNQNPSRLQHLLKEPDGINKVHEDPMFNYYADLADPFLPKGQKYDMPEYIEAVFDALKKESGMGEVKPLKKKAPSLDNFEDAITKFEETRTTKLSAEDESRLVDLNNDRNFWSRDSQEIKREYDLMSDSQKADFAGLFAQKADVGSSSERLTKLNDDISKLEDSRDSWVNKKRTAEQSIKKATEFDARELKREIAYADMKIKELTPEIAKKEAELSSVKANEIANLDEIMKSPKTFDFYTKEIVKDLDSKILDIVKDPDLVPKAKPIPKTKTEEPKQTKEPKEKKETTLKKWRDDIKFEDKNHNKLMNKIMTIPGMKDVKIVYNAKRPSHKDKGVAATYYPETNHIEVYSDKNVAKNVLHEAIHAATYHKVRDNAKLYNQLELLRRELVEKTGSKGYWSKNVDEMLAEFFSNKKVESGLERVKTGQTIPKGYMHKILDIILDKVFGVTTAAKHKTARQVLEDALEEISGIKIFEKYGTKEAIDKTISQTIDKALFASARVLRDNNIFKISKDGTVNIGSFETDAFKTILSDLGVSNKKTSEEISKLRAMSVGMSKEISEQSKVIAGIVSSALKEGKISERDLNDAIASRLGKVLKTNTDEYIDSMDVSVFANKYQMNPKDVYTMMTGLGQRGEVAKIHFRNLEEAQAYYRANGVKVGNDWIKDAEIVYAKHTIGYRLNKIRDALREGQDTPVGRLFDTLLALDKLEESVMQNKMIYGYMGFVGKHDFNLHVAKSNKEIYDYQMNKNWKQVGNSNTFYQLNLEPDVSNGILPSSAKPMQGTKITKNIKEEMARLDKEKIKYSIVRDSKTGTISHLRLYPALETRKVLGYSTDPSKLLARKFRRLSETGIRAAVSDSVGKEVADLFSGSPKPGFVKVDPEMAFHYKKMMGIKQAEDIFVKKEFADLLVGAKENLLYTGDSRLGKMMERAYKDTFKRFKRAVTIKSPSSIVNNYLVIPSMLKMAGVPAKDVPTYMHQAHKDYADYIQAVEKYYNIRTKHGKKAADLFMTGYKKKNSVAEMMSNGILQSSVDDALINLSHESDMFRYFFDSLSGGFKDSNFKRIVEEIEINPNSTIGKFFLNKFVMSDIVGRASMYSYLKKQGLNAKDAGKRTNDAFVDFAKPLPKPIRVLEEYGVPFIGWMYRMQMPIFKLMKENPTDTAMVVATYYALQAMFDDEKDRMQDGYAGDLKIDSWFLHSSFMDPGVLSGSPVAKGELPNITPQIHKEASAVIDGRREFVELFGLNIKSW